MTSIPVNVAYSWNPAQSQRIKIGLQPQSPRSNKPQRWFCCTPQFEFPETTPFHVCEPLVPISHLFVSLSAAFWVIPPSCLSGHLWAYFRDSGGVVPDNHSEVSHSLFSGECSCLHFVRVRHLWSAVKQSTIKWNMPILFFHMFLIYY